MKHTALVIAQALKDAETIFAWPTAEDIKFCPFTSLLTQAQHHFETAVVCFILALA